MSARRVRHRWRHTSTLGVSRLSATMATGSTVSAATRPTSPGHANRPSRRRAAGASGVAGLVHELDGVGVEGPEGGGGQVVLAEVGAEAFGDEGLRWGGRVGRVLVVAVHEDALAV